MMGGDGWSVLMRVEMGELRRGVVMNVGSMTYKRVFVSLLLTHITLRGLGVDVGWRWEEVLRG